MPSRLAGIFKKIQFFGEFSASNGINPLDLPPQSLKFYPALSISVKFYEGYILKCRKRIDT